VGYLTDQQDLAGAYIDGRRIGSVEKIVMDEPDPDRLGPYIRKALRDSFSPKLRDEDSESSEMERC
jgi:hypothetical protein